MSRTRVIIMGAAGRGFPQLQHLLPRQRRVRSGGVYGNTDSRYSRPQVSPELAGRLYPQGIPIYDQSELVDLIKKYDVDECVLSYSDLPYEYVMHLSAEVNAAGTNSRPAGAQAHHAQEQ